MLTADPTEVNGYNSLVDTLFLLTSLCCVLAWCWRYVKAELVLTAHPTEINRRTLLVKHQEVARRLEELEQIDRMGGSKVAGR